MRRTLLFIPHEFASIPVFGFGWMLGFLLLAAVVITGFLVVGRHRVADFWRANASVWAVLMGLNFLVPMIELPSATGEPVGMAIRGYGMMLLLGVACSVGLAVLRGRRYGISDDVMLGIAPWLLVGGIAGARLFYVVEYHDQFFTGEIVSTFRNIINFTEGGLVVYGSFIGGFLAGVTYVVRHRMPFLTMGDVIVPCLFIGLCLGRLGCLMNGCCYGNACEDSWSALKFPNGSPVYQEQLSTGELVGMVLNESRTEVVAVAPDSLAAHQGIEVGAKVTRLGSVRTVEESEPLTPMEDAPLGMIAVVNGKEIYWPASQLPKLANPVQPTQIMSSLGGLALCLSLCLFSHFVSRAGVVMFVGFASYAVLRFVMELLRNDEPGQFGTNLTIAQWVSVVVFLLSCSGLVWLRWNSSTPFQKHQVGPAGG